MISELSESLPELNDGFKNDQHISSILLNLPSLLGLEYQSSKTLSHIFHDTAVVWKPTHFFFFLLNENSADSIIWSRSAAWLDVNQFTTWSFQRSYSVNNILIITSSFLLMSYRNFHRHRQLLSGTRPVQRHHSVLSHAVWRLQQQHLHHVSLWLWPEVGLSVFSLPSLTIFETHSECFVGFFFHANRFRNCLKEAKDSISDAVGYTFFNLLKMHCFEFSHRLQCAQRNWFGMWVILFIVQIKLVFPLFSSGLYK